ncbi:hypothetical protein QLL95_gp0467 [Cotonvirus japonicus]|uniref:Ankyrin repeat protein n=1 Tax=Cotonvirus japonicus TaxID=2811091 RepID=A0ABM7NU71_9VIRU|nr:hypothetical protein QLL95_gp0467 [Cotonvirus japonicus]BCS83656.1 hypothetical protein [Cotonvirus japonicus]
MNDFKFKYCICYIKPEFDRYIKKSKLFIDKNTSIKIKFKDNYILIDINDFHEFIEFIIDNELICKKKSITNCYRDYYFNKYLNYIFKNNLLDHIKSPIIKRYIKFINIHDYDGYFNHKYSDIIMKACEYSSFDTIKITMKLTTVKDYTLGEIIFDVCKRNDQEFFKIFKYFVDLYCDTITNYFKFRTKKNDYLNFYDPECDNFNILETIAHTNNLQVFNYFIEKIDFAINSIDNTKLKPKYLNIYDKLLESHGYSQKIKNHLLSYCILYEKLIIANQLILDGANINKIYKKLIDCLFQNEIVNSIDFFIEKGMLDKNQINDRFKKSYEYGPKVAEVLVSNGADYELYVDKLMVKTKNDPNKDFYNYLKELKNQ